jgi:hypothetical protein
MKPEPLADKAIDAPMKLPKIGIYLRTFVTAEIVTSRTVQFVALTGFTKFSLCG